MNVPQRTMSLEQYKMACPYSPALFHPKENEIVEPLLRLVERIYGENIKVRDERDLDFYTILIGNTSVQVDKTSWRIIGFQSRDLPFFPRELFELEGLEILELYFLSWYPIKTEISDIKCARLATLNLGGNIILDQSLSKLSMVTSLLLDPTEWTDEWFDPSPFTNLHLLSVSGVKIHSNKLPEGLCQLHLKDSILKLGKETHLSLSMLVLDYCRVRGNYRNLGLTFPNVESVGYKDDNIKSFIHLALPSFQILQEFTYVAPKRYRLPYPFNENVKVNWIKQETIYFDF